MSGTSPVVLGPNYETVSVRRKLYTQALEKFGCTFEETLALQAEVGETLSHTPVHDPAWKHLTTTYIEYANILTKFVAVQNIDKKHFNEYHVLANCGPEDIEIMVLVPTFMTKEHDIDRYLKHRLGEYTVTEVIPKITFRDRKSLTYVTVEIRHANPA